MTLPTLPAQMIEAAARRWWEILIAEPRTPWEERDEEDRQHDRDQVSLILAAALGVCEVREEFDFECRDPNGCSGHWGANLKPPPTDSDSAFATLPWKRRHVFTTPAEPVDTEGAQT